MGSGAGALGAALGGRNALRRAAYDQRMDELAKAFVQAQMGRKYQSETALNNDTLSARGDLGQAFGNAYNLSPETAEAMAVLGRAAKTSNPEQLASMGMRQRAMGTSDPVAANQILAAVEGKPRDLTKIQGNTAFNPTLTPDQATMAPTQVGKAAMAADMARALASQESAARDRALTPLEAALKRAQTYNAEHGGRGSKQNVTSPSMSLLRQSLGDIERTDALSGRTYFDVSPDKLQAFLRWQTQQASSDPRFNDGDYALQQYLLTHGKLGALPTDQAPPLGEWISPTPAAAPAAPASASGSPYPEGTLLTGPDGRRYVVRGGVPVPEQ